jgi:hypothetical protein
LKRALARRAVVALGLVAGAAAAEPFSFVAFGDQPYGAEVAVGPSYRELLARIDALAPPFAIHVGDFKDGSSRCTDAEYLRQRAYFDSLATALVYTPGDNEWFDCVRQGDDPIERLAKLRALFFAAPRSLGRGPIAVERQADLMSAYPEMVENLRWVHRDVMFVTVHTIGPANGFDGRSAALQAEARAREAADIAWLRDSFARARDRGCQALVVATQGEPVSYREGRQRPSVAEGFVPLVARNLVPLAQRAPFPVLLVHGDGHEYTTDQPFFDAQRRPVANLWRLEVFGGQRMHAVKVLVDPRVQPPFRFEPIWNPLSPDPRY